MRFHLLIFFILFLSHFHFHFHLRYQSYSNRIRLNCDTKFFMFVDDDVFFCIRCFFIVHWIILNKSISLNRAINRNEQKSNSSSIWEITFEVNIILYHFSLGQFRLIGRKNQFLVIISTNWNALTRVVLNYIE